MKIYADEQSGNCYKVKLVCALLGIEHQWVHVDILAGDTAANSFLAKNPNGKIPLLALDDGRHLWESNAIINYVASGSDLLPTDAFTLAKVQQWQFFEQYSHEPYIAVARFIAKYLGLPEDKKAEYAAKQAGGHKALSVMESQLTHSVFLVGEQLTTADISLYGYTHVAHEGGFDLSLYPAVQAWLARIEALPHYVPMGSA
ncbi:glutathione S-transferase family protein [uncultured Paraglaciecola sp.]|uniref:glutathione S-transferase family protein n=1 Tax=uncultured Paraglaciecola sp. TaxID=1765024 RepID=UPI0030DBAC81|tara:strand:- start:83 stop:685 length:603 start_codon:yes stop_codon:yes gene_type:complete